MIKDYYDLLEDDDGDFRAGELDFHCVKAGCGMLLWLMFVAAVGTAAVVAARIW